MTDLERRALLGDSEAQRECTEKGIALVCPKCYGDVSITEVTETVSSSSMYFLCVSCRLGMRLTQMYAHGKSVRVPLNNSPLAQWNDRHAPPIGRCGECEYKPLCINYDCMKDNTGFCKWFKPKED